MAGSFYPSDPEELSSLVDRCYLGPLGPGRSPPGPEKDLQVAAAICPHAGLIYSGGVAAHSYLHLSSMRKPDLVVIFGPNHYGVGSGVSTFDEGLWETPLGRLRVDSDAARALVDETGIVDVDPGASRLEHSLEVQLPFIQKIYGDAVPILPVSLVFQDIETVRALAAAIPKVIKKRKAILIASSDMDHYEHAEVARRKDSLLIEKIKSLDAEGLYSTLESEQLTACGYGAMATLMLAAPALGFTRAELLKYANSGATTGDDTQVVGYGSLRFA